MTTRSRPRRRSGLLDPLAICLIALWACGDAFAAERLHNAIHPSWSPDGQTIIYEAGATGDRQIVELSLARWQADESQSPTIVPLTRGAQTLAAPAYSRNGDYIAYLRMGEVIELMVMGPDGSSPRRLVEIAGAPSLLTWTPDERIGFVSASEPGQFDVYLAALDGGVERLTDTPYSEKVPDVSPDGRRIAFQSGHLGAGDLFMLELSSGRVERLTFTEGRERLARWSPDGSRIAFQAEPEANFDIYVLGLADSSLRRVTTDPAGDSIPTWSPDGKKLAFVSTRRRPGSAEDGVDLYVVELKSSEPRCLTCIARLGDPSD